MIVPDQCLPVRQFKYLSNNYITPLLPWLNAWLFQFIQISYTIDIWTLNLFNCIVVFKLYNNYTASSIRRLSSSYQYHVRSHHTLRRHDRPHFFNICVNVSVWLLLTNSLYCVSTTVKAVTESTITSTKRTPMTYCSNLCCNHDLQVPLQLYNGYL